MNSLRLPALLIAGAALATTAVTASAAPNRTADLSSATPEYSWDGGPISGAVLGISATTDNTHVNLVTDGDLAIKLTEFSEPTGFGADFDIDLYAADAAGDPTGEPLASALEADAEQESLSVKGLKAGGYVIEVRGFLTFEGTFKGKVTFSGAGAAPTPTPAGPGATPTPPPGGGEPGGQPSTDATPDAKLRKVTRRSITGTASDDKGVKRVEVAIQARKGSKCTQMNRKGKFVKQAKCDAPSSWLTAKGTSKWSLKLPKKLKKGRYTFFARATDSAGQVQAGFTRANKRTTKVK